MANRAPQQIFGATTKVQPTGSPSFRRGHRSGARANASSAASAVAGRLPDDSAGERAPVVLAVPILEPVWVHRETESHEGRLLGSVPSRRARTSRRDLRFHRRRVRRLRRRSRPRRLMRVPSCPDWSLTELIWHLGRVQRFWAETVYAGDADPEFPGREGPSRSTQMNSKAWFRVGARLARRVEAVPWDAPAWTWWKEDRTVGAIARHQVQEAAVHRWDAQLARGPSRSVAGEDRRRWRRQVLWIARQMRGPEPIAFRDRLRGDVQCRDRQGLGDCVGAGIGSRAVALRASLRRRRAHRRRRIGARPVLVAIG